MLFQDSHITPSRSCLAALHPGLLAVAFGLMVATGIGIGWVYEQALGPRWQEPARGVSGVENVRLADSPDGDDLSPAPGPSYDPSEISATARLSTASAARMVADSSRGVAATPRPLPDVEPAPEPEWEAADIPAVPFIPLMGEGRETQELMQPTKKKAKTIGEVYDLSVHTESTVQPPAPLILMPDTDSIDLVADVVMKSLLPDGYQEQNLSVEWASADGRIEAESTQLTRASRARFYPTRRNHPATITLTLEVVFNPAQLAGRPTIHRLEKTVKVLVPISSRLMVNGIIDGYHIGEFLDTTDPEVRRKFRVKSDHPFAHPERYRAPSHYYRVTQELKSLSIAPHVGLDLFVIDFPWKSLGMPQYVAIDPNLVRKLEDIIELMQADGYNIDRFTPIYGFRPPSFNLSTIAERPDTNLKEPFSMHQYGRAVDVIVDMDGDGLMDDLNGDGILDMRDPAIVMHYVNLVDRRYREEGRMDMVGGAGLYHEHDFVERLDVYDQTPYIHIDTRGYLRDDQTLIRWPYAWPSGDPIRWGDM